MLTELCAPFLLTQKKLLGEITGLFHVCVYICGLQQCTHPRSLSQPARIPWETN